jgi:hypothetical protein
MADDPRIQQLPRDVMWYADPSGANECAELLVAGFNVREGNNSLGPGIAAVTTRLENGGLRVLEGRCPNLLAEAGLYRYGDYSEDRRSENPLDEHNHALAALRYLISAIDARKMAGPRPLRPTEEPAPEQPQQYSPQTSRTPAAPGHAPNALRLSPNPPTRKAALPTRRRGLIFPNCSRGFQPGYSPLSWCGRTS